MRLAREIIDEIRRQIADPRDGRTPDAIIEADRRAAQEEMRERACRAVCMSCQLGIPQETRDGVLIHVIKQSTFSVGACVATAIRALKLTGENE